MKEENLYFTNYTNEDFNFHFYNKWYSNVFSMAQDPRIPNGLQQKDTNDTATLINYCKHKLGQSIYVEIKKSTADVSTIQQNVRMTFTGALSNLGKLETAHTLKAMNIS